MSAFRLVFLVLVLLLGGIDPALAEATLWVTTDNVELTRLDDGFRVEISVLAPVPLAIAWQVLTDFDRMARFMPNLESSRIVAGQGSQTVQVEQRGTAHFGPFSQKFISLREIVMKPMGEIQARQLSGTAKSVESRMRLTAVGAQQTRLEYRSEIIAETKLPPLIGPAFVRHEMAEQFSASVGEMVRRQNGLAAASPAK